MGPDGNAHQLSKIFEKWSLETTKKRNRTENLYQEEDIILKAYENIIKSISNSSYCCYCE